MVCEKNLVLKKICSVKTVQHLTANLFLMNFGGILRSKVCTLRVKARRKTRKQITVRRFRSAPVRLGKRETSELGFERQIPAFASGNFLAISHITAKIPLAPAKYLLSQNSEDPQALIFE